jgi:dihydrolipoamide dehydrogenase
VAEKIELIVPDLGDFDDVEVIEILVNVGDTVAVEDALVTLETDKAAMDVPATHAGVIVSIEVGTGDKVSAGDKVATIEAVTAETADIESTAIINPKASLASATAVAAVATADSESTHNAQLVVIGSGPGGYTAAFRAADLGVQVILIERYPVLGGVCLNVGCIPSKALLHAAKVIDEAEAMADHGVKFAKPTIDALALRGWKNEVVGRLTGGITQLAKQRKVKVVHGVAKFASPKQLILDNGETIGFEKCIIAAGSESARLPGLPEDPRIVDSTGALELDPLPKRMLVVGGGIIGLEMACVYSALGTKVSVV